MTRALQVCSIALILLLINLPLHSQTAGTFRGVLATRAGLAPNWIYVQGPNGSLRRVEISKAEIVWGDSVPASARSATPKASLKEGTEVRVTATPDATGDWKADRIEILNVHATPVVVPRLSDRLPQNVAD